MALTQRLKQGFLRLSLSQQLGLVSALLLAVSPFLSWYEQRGSTGAVTQVMGIEGPLFLPGILIGLLGAASFFSAFFPLFGANFYKRPPHLAWMDITVSGSSLLLMGLASSVFFHPQFGLNLATKHFGVGMMLALASASILGVVGLWNRPAFHSVMNPASALHPQEPLMPEVSNDDWSREQLDSKPFLSNSPAQSLQTPINSAAVPVPTVTNPAPVDPLTLDPKTRYRLMQSRLNQQHSLNNRPQSPAPGSGNFWGSGAHSAFNTSDPRRLP